MRREIIRRVSERIICKHTGNYNDTYRVCYQVKKMQSEETENI